MIKLKKCLAIFMAGALIMTAGILPQESKANAAGDYGISNPRVENGVTTWDKIKFGSYYQDAEFEPEPIKWRVLSVDGDDAFLLADKGLDSKPYNEEDSGVTWETCTLRKWLNEDFYNEAFDDEEKAAIMETTVVNDGNPYYGSDNGNDTIDKIYLLSIYEASNAVYGFSDWSARNAKNTDYTNVKGTDTYEDGSVWWTRSHGNNSYHAAYVRASGYGEAGGDIVTTKYAVRPILHVNLLSYKVKDAGEVDQNGNVTALEDGIHSPRVEDNITTWDCVYFGNYKQRAQCKKQDIEWRVLSVHGDDAFLLADRNLDCKPYNEELTDVTWESCTLRKWLNNDFYNEAFNAEEKSAILETTVINDDNPSYGTKSGNDIIDNVYLLSVEEASIEAYGFTTDYEPSETRYSRNTDYAKIRGAITEFQYKGAKPMAYGNGCWWLRTSSWYSDTASFVEYYGQNVTGFVSVNHDCFAVRPVLHINLSSSAWSKAGTVISNEQSGEDSSEPTAGPNDDDKNIQKFLYYDNGDGTCKIYDYIGTSEKVIIPESINGLTVTEIYSGTFGSIDLGENGGISDSQITSISIPKTITSIGDFAFKNCSSLEEIKVDTQNTEYKTIDGVLYTSDGTVLICYPAKKADTYFTIPMQVNYVENYAFYFCSNLLVLNATHTMHYGGQDILYSMNKELLINLMAGSELHVNAIKEKIDYKIADIYAFTNDLNGFDLKTDGYAFINSHASFQYESDYKIPLSVYQSVYGKAYTAQQYESEGKWKGNCYGMSITSALFDKGYLNASLYGSKKVNELYDSFSFFDGYAKLKTDSMLKNLIECYQVWQSSEEGYANRMSLVDTIQSYEGMFLKVLNIIKETNEPLLVDVFWNGGGHTLVVDSVRKPVNLYGSKWRIYLYDPNNPYTSKNIAVSNYSYSEARYIDVDVNSGTWNIDVALNSNSNATRVGYDESGKFIDGSSVRFYSVDKATKNVSSQNATYISSKNSGSTYININDDNITIKDWNGNIVFNAIDGVVKHISDDITFNRNTGYVDDQNSILAGKLILQRGTYEVSLSDDGSAQILNPNCFVGVTSLGNTDVKVSDDGIIYCNGQTGSINNIVIEKIDGDSYTSVETVTEYISGENDIRIQLDDNEKYTISSNENTSVEVISDKTNDKEYRIENYRGDGVSSIADIALKEGQIVGEDTEQEESPTSKPTMMPTVTPIAEPSKEPQKTPTETPTIMPTSIPSAEPTEEPNQGNKPAVPTQVPIPPQESIGNNTTEGNINNVSDNDKMSSAITQSQMSAKIISVKNKKKGCIIIKWNKTADISGCQIQYSTNRKFKKAKKVTVSKTKYIIKELKKKKLYYIRLRIYKIVNSNKIYSSWSKVKKIRIKK